MDEQKPKLPPEAVELYTQFIHGEINRRYFMVGVSSWAIAGLAAGAVITR